VLGTVVAVLLLAFTIWGLEQVGVEAWIQSLIQGVALIVAVAFSSWALRRRAARLRAVQLKLLEDDSAVELAETVGAPSGDS
jgi:ribose transport system permease protein